jgi:lipopolysaccharide/colanic/teichoic acid biosynthesis glycosyltransferase
VCGAFPSPARNRNCEGSGLRGDIPTSDRARFDNYYVENWSLWLDFKMLPGTIREVVVGGGR